MTRYLQEWKASFTEIFSFRDEESKGRVISLTSTLLVTFYNVFITGIFYTGFLTMYGMSITDTGILTFVPYIANLLSIFSPKLLGRFKKRKKLLLGAKIIYYALYIVATTVMPQFVTDTKARMVCFIVILALATGFFAFFGSGFTTWFYNFYPADTTKRTRFIMLSQIFASILSSFVLLFSGLLTDALSNSPYQDTLILIFRYVAFGLVLVEVFIQSKAKEYPYQETADTKITDVFTLPFKYKKFLYCMIFQFIWNFMANLNNGLWNFHLLNHLDFSYTIINTLSILYTFVLLIFSSPWQKVLRRFSWIKTFGIAMLLFFPSEFAFFFMNPSNTWMFIPVGVYQHIINVGINIAYANILYMNLPQENSTAHICFNIVGCNIFAFLGLMTGTMISSITGDNTMTLLGMEVYSVQFTTIVRGILFIVVGLYLVIKWKNFTNDEIIAEIEGITPVKGMWRIKLMNMKFHMPFTKAWRDNRRS